MDLLAIQLDDQLLVDRQIDIFTLRQRGYTAFVIIAVTFHPVRGVVMARKSLSCFQDCQLRTRFADRDFVSHAHWIRRNIHLTSVHVNMAMANQLTRLTTGNSKSHAVNNAVETALKLLQQDFAGNTLRADGFLEIIPELAFLGEIHALGFLFFAQLQAIAHNLRFSVLAMLAGGKVALFDGTLVAMTSCAF